MLILTNRSGTATIKNNNSGESVSYTFFNEGMWGTLGLFNAEWIVEDFILDSFGFADFGSVNFTDATATISNGSTVLAGSGHIIDMVHNNTIITRTSMSGSTVDVFYI